MTSCYLKFVNVLEKGVPVADLSHLQVKVQHMFFKLFYIFF